MQREKIVVGVAVKLQKKKEGFNGIHLFYGNGVKQYVQLDVLYVRPLFLPWVCYARLVKDPHTPKLSSCINDQVARREASPHSPLCH